MMFGSLNCRGGKTEIKKSHLADDMYAYDLEMLAVQETHTTTEGPETIETSDRKSKYILHISDKEGMSRAAVGIIVKSSAKECFTPVSERLCMCSIEIHKPRRKVVMICAYAPTLPNSEKNPETREEFYNDLESLIKMVRRKDILLVASDFNAQTGSGYHQFSTNMGKFGKGALNTNGRELLELAGRNDLILANTMFHHKLAHVTTWESPYRKAFLQGW